MTLRIPLRKLSSRQRQVLQLLAAGLSTRGIARQLRLSVKTVETHRAKLMHRTDIHDLAGLVRYAVWVGIVSAGQGSDWEPPGDALMAKSTPGLTPNLPAEPAPYGMATCEQKN